MRAPKNGCSGCSSRIGADYRTLCVGSASDLNILLRTFRRYDSVYIVSQALSTEERGTWERQLADAYTECGCNAGAIALLAALCLVFSLAVASPLTSRWPLAFAGGFCFIMMILGKIVGIGFARLRLWRLIRHLRLRLELTAKAG